MTTTQTRHNYEGAECLNERCRQASGWQCVECGHYFDRSQIKDIDGEYYCRSGQGHNRK
jgi:hypothetical protein